jgi:hypothetical protein
MRHVWGRGEVLRGFWSEGSKRPLGRPRRRWKYKIREMGIDGAKWIRLAQDMVHWRVFVSTVMNLRAP